MTAGQTDFLLDYTRRNVERVVLFEADHASCAWFGARVVLGCAEETREEFLRHGAMEEKIWLLEGGWDGGRTEFLEWWREVSWRYM